MRMNTGHENAQSGKVSHTPWESHRVDEHSRQNRAHKLSTITFDLFWRMKICQIFQNTLLQSMFSPGHWEKPVMWNSYLPHGVKSIPVSRHCTRCCQIAGYAIHPIEKKRSKNMSVADPGFPTGNPTVAKIVRKWKKKSDRGGGCVPGAALGCAIAWCWFSTFISLTSSLKYIIIMWSSLDLLTQRNRRFCPRLEQ